MLKFADMGEGGVKVWKGRKLDRERSFTVCPLAKMVILQKFSKYPPVLLDTLLLTLMYFLLV